MHTTDTTATLTTFDLISNFRKTSILNYTYRVFFYWCRPKKYEKVRSGVSRTIYVNVESTKLGFPDFNFFGGHQ